MTPDQIAATRLLRDASIALYDAIQVELAEPSLTNQIAALQAEAVALMAKVAQRDLELATAVATLATREAELDAAVAKLDAVRGIVNG